MIQSGLLTSFSRWHALVVTELAPAHHSREKSHLSLTTHKFTSKLFSRSFLSDTRSNQNDKTVCPIALMQTVILTVYLTLQLYFT
uniref:Uncharacterized protein n=1 Tax=Neogobius melanostomus TaxID=47308 RepID=A0A8C6WHH8_9GOBI